MRPNLPTLALVSLMLGACAGGPHNYRSVEDPELETEEQAKRRADDERRELTRGLLNIEQSLNSYVNALAQSGAPTQDSKLEKIESLLRQLVNGGKDEAGRTLQNADMPRYLIALASDSSDERNQATALAAMGFLEDPQALSLLLSGAQLENPFLVDRAILGLAIKKDPRTPPGVVAAVLKNQQFPEQTRIQAAWALYVLQESTLRKDEIPPVWQSILAEHQGWHPLIVATAVRGMGLTREAKYADVVLPFLEHPTTKVRMNAAVALGRMNAQDHYEALITLLGPQEVNQNVRLAARKALQALAGGQDRGYDVKMWRREFQRIPERIPEPGQEGDKGGQGL